MSCPAVVSSFLNSLLASFQIRDFIGLVAILVAAVTFWMKLNADAKAARFRETIGFLDRNDTKLKAAWERLKTKSPQNGLAWADPDALEMLNLLDTAALLVKKKAFDSELVYNHWWDYFNDPIDTPAIAKWIEDHQAQDAAVLEHYSRIHKTWKARVERERKKSLKRINTLAE